MQEWLQNFWARVRDASATRLEAARAWSGRHLAPLGRRVGAAPWKTIGLWAGGVFAVLAVSLVLFLTFADWNAMRGPIARFASNATGRPIEITGNLDVNPWSWTPEVHVEGLRIGNPRRFAEREDLFANIERVDAAVRLLPLFVGRFDFSELAMQGADIALYRDAEGVGNWSSGERRTGKPFDLPAIRRFSVSDGRLRYEDDKRGMTIDAEFTSQEQLGEGGQFHLAGDGSMNGYPFKLDLTGAPLLNVRRDRPYAFQADVRAGATRIRADGAIRRPFDLSYFEADVRASGADLANLYYLLGLTLPNTPPYNLTGTVNRTGTRYTMTNINGRVGDSDLSGQFEVSRQRNDRPFFEGAFRSRSLDFDDLLAVLGGAPDTDETASPEQRAEAERLAAQGRLLPDARLDISRVRNMDARVDFVADDVRTEKLPLRGFSLDISLDNGLLRLDPMTLNLAQGRLNGAVAINAREDVPQVDLDVRLSNARLETLIPMQGDPAVTGALSGRVRLTGHGAAVREAAANANGAVSLVIPSGEVREAFAELTGINVTRGLGLLLTDDQSKIGIRCGVADFQVRNGVLNAQSIVVDTETMLISGRGTVSLRDETMNLRIEGEAKEPRLVSISAPITIGGRLRSPSIGVEADDALGQGGLAAALGSLVAPLAAVLPFIDADLAEDANCAGLMAEARGGSRG